VAVELTSDDVGDVSELPGVLDKVDAELAVPLAMISYRTCRRIII
jgi:hypothetical protein